MRLVAVSTVKNEADVIEAFVRHTAYWVDHHLIFDHDSTDGTREILFQLQREGLPLSLFTDDCLGNLQQFRSNYLMRHAAAHAAADWILPLDADEFVDGPDRASLEKELLSIPPEVIRSSPLRNYFCSPSDDTLEANPALRLRFAEPPPFRTRKIIVPRSLALTENCELGKGCHEMKRDGQPITARPLSESFAYAHLPLRSRSHQALRLIQSELQKLSLGAAAASVDVHYRLGFQLLAETPDLFSQIASTSRPHLELCPINYRGDSLKFIKGGDSTRLARALLPFLEKLARSHGRLLDAAPPSAESSALPVIRELARDDTPLASHAGKPSAFAGFTPGEGWCPQEGPVPEAYLPVFHWSLAPQTTLEIAAPSERLARFHGEIVTYSENQILALELNGQHLKQHRFSRTNQCDTVTCALPLRAGANTLIIRYAQALRSEFDPRLLAAIFLSLRIE